MPTELLVIDRACASCTYAAMDNGTSPRRFVVGQRVRCKTSATQWKRGTIIKLNYREQNWPAGRVAPYQIELQNGVLIFAPQDTDCLIRADDGEKDSENQDVASEIHVCQAGPCRRAGGEAVLLEIEELARSVGKVVVQSSGCLGNCSNAPNALLVSGDDEQIFAKLCTLSATADVVEKASGRAPNLDDAAMVQRLDRARRLRIRMEAREESKWNLALAGLAEDAAQAEDEDDRAELVQEQAELLASAGFADRALEVLSTVAPTSEALSLDDIPRLRLLLDKAKILARAGRLGEIEALRSRAAQLPPRGPREANIKAQVMELLAQTIVEVPMERVNATRPHIEDYARWKLHAVTPVSKHSAVYHFRTDDASRGTPIRKGRGGRTVWSKTWHTTMLAEVGSNAEGPLPWIERDYTPISTAHDWERGLCDILIKVYLQPAGKATEWLHRLSIGVSSVTQATAAEQTTDVTDVTDAAGGAGDTGTPHASEGCSSISGASGPAGAGAVAHEVTIWLSRPMKTLHVPSLSSDDKYINRKHASVLLLVAGTGVVAVPQVLHHANAGTYFGGRGGPPITQPISVIYSCRVDDALLIPELVSLCREGSLARCTVLLTASQTTKAPFPDAPDVNVEAAVAGVDNAVCLKDTRLSVDLLQAQLCMMRKPMRIVVSGPEGFNAACKSMLKQVDGDLGADAVTILSA